MENTKSKILHTAITLLAQGETKLSMSQIAATTGISKSALYHFFASKKDLFQEVVFFIFEQLITEIERIAQEKTDPKEKMWRMMMACIACSQTESTVTHFLFQQVFQNDQNVLKKIHTMREQLKSFFTKTLEEGMRQGIFRKQEVDKTSEIVVGYLDFIALRSALPCPKSEEHISAESLCKHLLAMVEGE